MTAWQTAEVRDVLSKAEDAARKGAYVAGFVSYDAAPAFDEAFVVRAGHRGPLAEFQVYARPPQLYKEIRTSGGNKPAWVPDTNEVEFVERVQEVKRLLAEGETYQVNLTFRLKSDRRLDVAALFSLLTAGDLPPYASLYQSTNLSLASLSPELFFESRDGLVRCKPMKGTAPSSDDVEQLRMSEKDRAENVMVVDMVRNDLGRIAKTGTVRTPELFHVERFPTVLQMTSTVEAEVRGGISEVFGALFPSASIVGAPKVATMRHIARLETTARGVYTGAIGWVTPSQHAQFSVAIRTLSQGPTDACATYGVGSGIVWDSDAESEYRECLLKAQALEHPMDPWGLLETLRWTPSEGYALLDLHLKRLAASASELRLPLDLETIASCLADAASGFEGPRRVRLVLDFEGGCQVDSEPLTSSPGVLDARIADRPVSSQDPSLRHKTTRRRLYDRLIESGGVEEALLWNERREATEFCNGNLVVDRKGSLVTPPLESGLLPGTFRESLLAEGVVRESPVPVDSLFETTIWRVNSVRGWQRVRLLGAAPPSSAAEGQASPASWRNRG